MGSPIENKTILNSSGNISIRFNNTSQIDINSSMQYSTVELFSEEDKEGLMFSLPIDECFDLINYEPKSSIDPLAQTVPSLNMKTKQIPIETPQKYKGYGQKSISSEKDLLSNKMSSYSSLKKKRSNQVNKGKLSNYINSKKTETKVKTKEATKRLKVDITPKKIVEMNY